jgi:hypothetical protein
MIFLLIDNGLSDNQLLLLGDLLNVCEVTESDELLEHLPSGDLYIIDISKLKLIHFYETNKSEAKEIVYYKTRNIFRDDEKIGHGYTLKNFPAESKTKEELIKKLLVDNQLERVSKCGSCCDFLANKITCSKLCKYLCSCLSAAS